MKAIILVAAVALSACGGRAAVPVETITRIERVPVPAPCPDRATYNDLVAGRPKPLAAQAMPATAQERTAKTAAQLGRYEAKGAWADQVSAALERCQKGEDLTPGR